MGSSRRADPLPEVTRRRDALAASITQNQELTADQRNSYMGQLTDAFNKGTTRRGYESSAEIDALTASFTTASADVVKTNDARRRAISDTLNLQRSNTNDKLLNSFFAATGVPQALNMSPITAGAASGKK